VEGIRPLAPRIAGGGKREPGTEKREAGSGRGETGGGKPAALPDPVPFAERSRWAKKIAAGEFVTSVEIVPPRGVDASRMLSDVGRLKVAGVDAVNVPDGPRAQSRMGALLTSVPIGQQVGIESVTPY